MPARTVPVTLRYFRERIVVDENGCWIWQRYRDAFGYGRHHRNLLCHRSTYQLVFGDIPSGYHVDHLCRVPACCNPRHLEPVTPAENIRRQPTNVATRRRAWTHCIHGHAFDEENTYWQAGHRACRTCARNRKRLVRREQQAQRAV